MMTIMGEMNAHCDKLKELGVSMVCAVGYFDHMKLNGQFITIGHESVKRELAMQVVTKVFPQGTVKRNKRNVR